MTFCFTREQYRFPLLTLRWEQFLHAFSKLISLSPHKSFMFFPVREIHWAFHLVLAFLAFMAKPRPVPLARQTGWRRGLSGRS